MKSDVITVSSDGARMEEALNQAAKVADYSDLSGKDALHLRLLGEEMLCVMRAITGEMQGKFWIENEDGLCSLHLLVETPITAEKRKQLLSVSTTGKNEATKSFMGRLREFFFSGADEDIASFSNPVLLEKGASFNQPPVLDWQWSMLRYQEELKPLVEKKDENALVA
ncbi:MAG: hypothetical protein K6G83_02735 [Lachnospiraceae bacterium]|nr:hypothetical protein [Lachnospiraceae bacterium]